LNTRAQNTFNNQQKEYNMKLIVHPGTGTIVDLNECLVIESNDLDGETLDDLIEYESSEIMTEYGKKFDIVIR